MNGYRSAAAFALLLAFSATVARGEEPSRTMSGAASLVVGSRLRVTAPGVSPQPIVGTLVEMSEREVVISLSSSDRKAIPRSAMTLVERSEGRKGHAVKGLLIGGATGLGWVAIAVAAGPGGDGDGTSFAVVVGSIITGAAALIGAGIGASIRTERWTPVASSDLRLTLRPTKGRGVAAALTWSW